MGSYMLGGKDPAYVRADADLEQAVATVVDGAFFNSGQSCCGIERAYVAAQIFDDFVAGSVADSESPFDRRGEIVTSVIARP